METTTDFNGWIENASIESAEDMLEVYRTVLGEEGRSYSMSPARGGGFLLRAPSSDVQLLLTPRSRAAFVAYMDSLYELGVEGQAAFEHAMQKDD